MRIFKAVEDIIIFGKLVLEKDRTIKIDEVEGYNISGEGYNFNLYLNDIESDNRFIETKPKQTINIDVIEVLDEDILEIKDFRIQLDIKTSRKKLIEINNLFRKILDEVL